LETAGDEEWWNAFFIDHAGEKLIFRDDFDELVRISTVSQRKKADLLGLRAQASCYYIMSTCG
jgi:hypothetical protein